jgi:hypothetical protein
MPHGWIDIKPEKVWTAIRDGLPHFKSMVERELQQLNVDDPPDKTD